MPALYERPPRVLTRQFLVWFAWFLLTGYVFHGRTRYELRELSVPAVAMRVTSLGIVVAASYWFVRVMPSNVRTLLFQTAGVGVLLGVAPFAIQTGVTTILERRQFRERYR